MRAPEFKKNLVTSVQSDSIQHRLFICLDAEIVNDTIERVAALPDNDVFICFDSSLTDEAKLRLVDVGNVRTI
jgi:adenine-specific DNA-methyltransferase